MLANHVTLIGNLGSDLRIRTTPAGQTVANVNLAVSRRYKASATGEFVEETQWFPLVIWAERADRMAARVKCGDRVLVEGSLRRETYEGKDGVKRDLCSINVARYEKLARPGAGKADEPADGVRAAVGAEAPAEAVPA